MKLLIIDDHVIVREGVRRLFATQTDVVTIDATSAVEALAQFRTHRPDLVLLDLNLASDSGFELLRRLLAEDKSARILIFSMHGEPLYVARALDAGARGYVNKSAPASELVAAIQKVAADGHYVEHDVAAQLVVHRYSSEAPFYRLTTREADIMRQLGEGKTLATIATALGVSYKTVANTCSVIKTKLGVDRLGDLIRLAIEMRES